MSYIQNNLNNHFNNYFFPLDNKEFTLNEDLHNIQLTPQAQALLNDQKTARNRATAATVALTVAFIAACFFTSGGALIATLVILGLAMDVSALIGVYKHRQFTNLEAKKIALIKKAGPKFVEQQKNAYQKHVKNSEEKRNAAAKAKNAKTNLVIASAIAGFALVAGVYSKREVIQETLTHGVKATSDFLLNNMLELKRLFINYLDSGNYKSKEAAVNYLIEGLQNGASARCNQLAEAGREILNQIGKGIMAAPGMINAVQSFNVGEHLAQAPNTLLNIANDKAPIQTGVLMHYLGSILQPNVTQVNQGSDFNFDNWVAVVAFGSIYAKEQTVEFLTKNKDAINKAIKDNNWSINLIRDVAGQTKNQAKRNLDEGLKPSQAKFNALVNVGKEYSDVLLAMYKQTPRILAEGLKECHQHANENMSLETSAIIQYLGSILQTDTSQMFPSMKFDSEKWIAVLAHGLLTAEKPTREFIMKNKAAVEKVLQENNWSITLISKMVIQTRNEAISQLMKNKWFTLLALTSRK